MIGDLGPSDKYKLNSVMAKHFQDDIQLRVVPTQPASQRSKYRRCVLISKKSLDGLDQL
jgi:hypothetical protein